MSTPAARSADPVPSASLEIEIKTSASLPTPDLAGAVAVPVASDREVPAELGFERPALEAAGFRAERGATLVVPSAGGPGARRPWHRRPCDRRRRHGA